MAKKVGGLLAARKHWCRPDEFVRLAVGSSTDGIRYDVGGLSWEGVPGTSAGMKESAGRASDWAFDVLTTSEDDTPGGSGEGPPGTVLFGAGEQSLIMRAMRPWLGQDRAGLWLLTSQRLAWLEFPPEAEENSGGTGDSWLGRVRKFSEGARDLARDMAEIAQGKLFGDYEPHAPVQVAEVVGRVEFPLSEVRSIDQTKRRLPITYSPRNVHALRIQLGDGSGFEVLSAGQSAVGRMHAMALGHR